LIVVLSIALIAAVVWAVVEHNRTTTPPVPTSAQLVAAVDNSVTAWNSGDAAAIAAVYTPDAVFEELISGRVWNGVDEISSVAADYAKARGPNWLKETSMPAFSGDSATYAFTYGKGTALGIALVTVNADGMITYQMNRAVEDVRIVPTKAAA